MHESCSRVECAFSAQSYVRHSFVSEVRRSRPSVRVYLTIAVPYVSFTTKLFARIRLATSKDIMLYKAASLLGEGAFGKVYKAKCSDNDTVSSTVYRLWT